jgi:hypothetical protein
VPVRDEHGKVTDQINEALLTIVSLTLALISHPVALVSLKLALISHPVALVSLTLALVDHPVALVGLPVALIGQPVALTCQERALPRPRAAARPARDLAAERPFSERDVLSGLTIASLPPTEMGTPLLREGAPALGSVLGGEANGL